jgi:pimeloyl-ACP methyl ester carboxylesterase
LPSLDHRRCRLAYEVQGQGPPVLLIQGVGVHGGGWRPQVEALAERFTCLSFDNPTDRRIARARPGRWR